MNTTTHTLKARENRLRGMYLYTLIGAGGFGTGIVFFPERITAMLGWSSRAAPKNKYTHRSP